MPEYTNISIKKSPSKERTFLKSGGKRIRTADPLHAMQVLYQLSYTPEFEFQCNTSQKRLSITKRRCTQIFLLFCTLFFLNGCFINAETRQTQGKTRELEKAYHDFQKAPFGLEAHEVKVQNHTLLRTLESQDKYGRNRVQLYLKQPLNIPGILRLLPTTKDVIWIDMGTHHALCQKQNLPGPIVSFTQEKKYTYENENHLCFFDYLP